MSKKSVPCVHMDGDKVGFVRDGSWVEITVSDSVFVFEELCYWATYPDDFDRRFIELKRQYEIGSVL